MPFVKGKSGNPEGRPQGAISERTKRWEELGEYITTAGAERAMEALNALPDEEFLEQYAKFLEYFKPKQARTVHAGDSDAPIIIQVMGEI
jgi:hypothetical protein